MAEGSKSRVSSLSNVDGRKWVGAMTQRCLWESRAVADKGGATVLNGTWLAAYVLLVLLLR